jgi:hypothetical protein
MDLGLQVKNFYYSLEDNWYNLLDWMNNYVPVYKVIDPIDRVVPSFILFLLLLLLTIVFAGYLIQFSSPVEVTFTTIDSQTKENLARVSLSGIINDDAFDGQTDNSGKFSFSISGKSSNIYDIIIGMFFGSAEQEISAVVNAEKQGYNKIKNFPIDLESNAAKIALVKSSGTVSLDANYPNKVFVELVDSSSGESIINSDGSGFVKFKCNNKDIAEKTARDATDGETDGVFTLNETNCQFVITGAYSPGYEEKSGMHSILPTSQNYHQITLNKVLAQTKGGALVKVYQYGTANLAQPTPVINAQVTFLSSQGINVAMGNTDMSGVIRKDLDPGTYTVTVSSIDGNYGSITADANKRVTVTVGTTSTLVIEMIKINPADIRILKIRVLDNNDDITPIGGAAASVQRIGVDSNGMFVAKEAIGTCSNGCVTDSNGVITVTGLSVQQDGNIVVTIRKPGFRLLIFKPTLYRVGEGPQTVYMSRADSSNSGDANVEVKQKTTSKPLYNAKTYLYMNYSGPELVIKGILVLQDGLYTNASGLAFYHGLPPADYYAKARFDGIDSADSNIYGIDAGQSKKIPVFIDLNASIIEINLLDNTGAEIPNVTEQKAVVKLFKASDAQFSSIETTPIENLKYASGLFTSSGYAKSENLFITIDLNEYVSNFVEIREQTLANGLNRINVRMYPVGFIDENTANVKIVFNGMYKNSADLLAGRKATFLTKDNNSYYARIDILINGDVNYSSLLSMLKINHIAPIASIDNIGFKTPLYFMQNGLYNTAMQEAPNRSNNDENFFLPSDPAYRKTDANIGLQAGIKWANDILPNGTYYYAPLISIFPDVTEDDKLDLNYFAKANYALDTNEDRGRTILNLESPICDSRFDDTCSKIFFDLSINNRPVHTLNFDYNKLSRTFHKDNVLIQTIPDTQNNLSVSIVSNTSTQISNLKLSAFSASTLDPTVAANGNIRFDSVDGNITKVLSTTMNISPFGKSDAQTANFFIKTPNFSTYLFLKAEVNSEVYYLVVDTQSRGRALMLEHSKLFAGVSDQNFQGTLLTSTGNIPIDVDDVRGVSVVLKKNCRSTIESNYTESEVSLVNDYNANHFTTNIKFMDGNTLRRNDCMILDVYAKESYFEPIHKLIFTDGGRLFDPAFSCLDVTFPGQDNLENDGNNNLFLNWNQKSEIVITNNCFSAVDLMIDAGVKLNNHCDTNLAPDQNCTIEVTGVNKNYDPSAPAPNFTDILGVFPLYVKAKLANSRKNFTLAATVKVHLNNTSECFLISRDTFDLMKEASPIPFDINNSCQYTLIDDYYIPRALINIAGVDINGAPEFDYIDFYYNFAVTGGGFNTTYQDKLVTSPIYFNAYATDPAYTKTDLGDGLARYGRFVFPVRDFDGVTNKLFFKWVDTTGSPILGAKIDGSITVKYTDGTTRYVYPALSFDINQGTSSMCICNGSVSPTDYCGSPEIHCMRGTERGDVLQCGNECNLDYGLMYVEIPQGEVQEFSFDVIGNANPAELEIRAITWVTYTEKVPVITPNGTSSSSNFGDDSFRIYPAENLTFILKSFGNNAVSINLAKKQNYCTKERAKTAWIDNDHNKVFWTTNYKMSHANAETYCGDNYFVGSTGTLATEEEALAVPAELAANSQWMNTGAGFWLNGCAGQNCNVLNKTATGFVKGTADNLVTNNPLCVSNVYFRVSDAECNAMRIICDSDSNTCHMADQLAFNMFIDPDFLIKTNPIVDFNIYKVLSGSTVLPESSVMIWIEGGLLKAKFVGTDYEPYNDGNMRFELVATEMTGDDYGIINIVDYVNKR